MGYTPHVLVIGGGATGTGVARDLAMRGLEVTLVDRGSLAAGTSGSMHALLHSGARYAVDDAETARRCARESQVLREIAEDLVDDTGGLFASLPSDDGTYLDEKREACEDAEIPVEELTGEAAREREPRLTRDVERALAVPDAVVDPAGLCVANARSAVRHGAEVRTGWEVVDVETEAGAVDTVRLRDENPAIGPFETRTFDQVSPDYVVNAAGPWAGEIAAMAGLDVPIRHTRGAMVVTERAGLETVLNRCRPRTEGDIAVPFGGSTILGTTDRDVDGPEATERDPAEVNFLVDELGDLAPAFATARPYRAFWGVRALPDEDEAATTDVSRSFTLLDHEARDDCWGMSTVFGGKLSIYRHVAEQVTDHVCAKFGIDRECRTAALELPVEARSARPLDRGDGETGAGTGHDPVLCEDRGVSRSAVRAVVEDDELPPRNDLHPVIQRTGAATGPSQGGRCLHRLAVELYPDTVAAGTARALDDAAAERWDGLRYAAWGEQLATVADTYRLHAATLNRDGHPGPTGEIDYGAYDPGPAPEQGDADEPGSGDADA